MHMSRGVGQGPYSVMCDDILLSQLAYFLRETGAKKNNQNNQQNVKTAFNTCIIPGACEPPEGRKERPTAWNGI